MPLTSRSFPDALVHQRGKLYRTALTQQHCTAWVSHNTGQCSVGVSGNWGRICRLGSQTKLFPHMPSFSSPAFCLWRHFLWLARTRKLQLPSSRLPYPEVAASQAGFATWSLSFPSPPAVSSIIPRIHMSELAGWVTCMSRRETLTPPSTRSVTLAGPALQLRYNLVLPPYLPFPSNCFWTDGKPVAWLCD